MKENSPYDDMTQSHLCKEEEACVSVNRQTLIAIIERYDQDSYAFLSEAKRHYDLMEELKELAQIPEED